MVMIRDLPRCPVERKGETFHLDSKGDREGERVWRGLVGVCDPSPKFLE